VKLKAPSLRSLGVAAVAVVGVLLVAGSVPTSTVGPQENAALSRAVGQVSQDGGTLTLGSTSLCDSFDPAKSFDTWCGVIFRLYSRNLMTFAGQPGVASLQTQPDLAANAPIVSEDRTNWKFKLRGDAKFSDGSPVTAQDVKYSVERLFAPEMLGTVSQDFLCLLSSCTKGIAAYTGPYSARNKSLASINTSGKYQITFQLNSPSPDFDRILALPQFAVVERVREAELRAKGRSYGDAPASSGPFVFHFLANRKGAYFTRNKNWHQSSDAIRSPHVTRINWQLFANSTRLNRATVRNQIDIRLGQDFNLADSVTASALGSGRNQLDHPFDGYTSFIAVRPQAAPLNRIACRQAIFYALDKSALQSVLGGADYSNIAQSLLSPTLAGYDPSSDAYSSAANPSGDLPAAQEALLRCGYPDGFELSMAYLNIGVGSRLFHSVQASLARVGIVVAPKRFDTFEKFITITRNSDELTNENISLVISGAQSTTGSALDYWSAFVDGRLIKPFDNQNLAGLDDAAINSQLDQMTRTPETTNSASAAIDSSVMAKAVYLPYAHGQVLMYRNPRVLGIYIQQALAGQYDVVNVGLPAK
jgi:peptide/nickel transport system substrate-binding protein